MILFPYGFTTVSALRRVLILQNRSICIVCPWWVCLKVWYPHEWFLHCVNRDTLLPVGKRYRTLNFPWLICGGFYLSIQRVCRLNKILEKYKDFFMTKDAVYECRLSWGTLGFCEWFQVLWKFISGFIVFGDWWLWLRIPCWGCAGGRLYKQRRRTLFPGGQVRGCKVRVCWWRHHKVKSAWRSSFECFALDLFLSVIKFG